MAERLICKESLSVLLLSYVLLDSNIGYTLGLPNASAINYKDGVHLKEPSDILCVGRPSQSSFFFFLTFLFALLWSGTT